MMPTAQPELSIVIPCYREGEKILQDLQAATAFLAGEGIDGEVVVVDDGSPDETAKNVEKFMASDARVKLVRYEKNRGKGYALRQGVAASQGRRVMFADAGLCVSYQLAKEPLRMLKEGRCDMVVGSRAVKGAMIRRSSPWYRKLGSRGFWILLRLFMGIPKNIPDTQCGFKFYDGPKARELFAACTIDGFMIDIELLRRAFQAGWKIENHPVEWSNDSDTRFNPLSGSWRILWELFKIRLKT